MKPIVTDPAAAVTGFDVDVRINRLATATARQQREALLFLSGYAPAVFDAVLDSIDDEDESGAGEEAEPFCGFCGERVGIFQWTGPYWMHYRGEQPDGPFQIVDPGHDPVVTWRLAPEVAVVS
jgi:hypothetical protein